MNWLSSAIQAALILLTNYVTFWFTRRHYRYQQRHTYVTQQLQEFYSPLLGIREEIRIKSELRVKIHAAADAEWQRLCREIDKTADPIARYDDLEREKGKLFEGVIHYDNEKLVSEIIPFYRRMLAIFREKLWLAEPETKGHLPALIEFVELWDRWLAKALPAEVIKNLGHSEKKLYPLYGHLEKKHEELRILLSQGKA